MLTETWLRQYGDEAKCRDLTPPGYTLFSFPRSHDSNIKRGGGIAIIIKAPLAQHCAIRTDFPFAHQSFEVAQLTLTIQEQRVTIFLLYRPPPNKKNKLSVPLFFDELPDFLDFCHDCQNNIVLAGDFNFHVDDPNDASARKLCEQLEMFNLTQTVTEPTHKCGHTLDLVVHRNDDNIVYSTNVCHDLASDHYAVLCHLAVQKPKHPATFVCTRSIRKIDHDKFASDIAQVVSPNMSASEFNKQLAAVFEEHAPVCQRKVPDRKPSPWYPSIAKQLGELTITLSLVPFYC
eukprot:TRINITY_DN20961_c0_g1_i1.p2 TRINITY_DN20961_c0_g1~~TRINITY_DN20961_c0_g1_i1.p2  ORF type:complete len:290 (-),score=34.81 TRINITY_DN20961_c0_g1_i1:2017-2886(-)